MKPLINLTLKKWSALWYAGKVSLTESMSYILAQLMVQRRTNTELERAHLALSLTVYALKAEVDSLKARLANDEETRE